MLTTLGLVGNGASFREYGVAKPAMKDVYVPLRRKLLRTAMKRAAAINRGPVVSSARLYHEKHSIGKRRTYQSRLDAFVGS